MPHLVSGADHDCGDSEPDHDGEQQRPIGHENPRRTATEIVSVKELMDEIVADAVAELADAAR